LPRNGWSRPTCTPDEAARQRYYYAFPAFGFTCRLIHDDSGLVLDYPGMARRPSVTPSDASMVVKAFFGWDFGGSDGRC
jgi:hypothetical protein